MSEATALERFGKHLVACPRRVLNAPVQCTCGLDAAIAQAKAATGSVEEAAKAAAEAVEDEAGVAFILGDDVSASVHERKTTQQLILAALAPRWPQGSAGDVRGLAADIVEHRQQFPKLTPQEFRAAILDHIARHVAPKQQVAAEERERCAKRLDKESAEFHGAGETLQASGLSRGARIIRALRSEAAGEGA